MIAIVQFPNFSAPLASMAQSLEKLAGGAPPQGGGSSPGAEVAPQQAAPMTAVPARTAPPAADRARAGRSRESGLTHARVPALLLADHPARLPLPEVCPGQADRPRDHPVLVVVRAALGHHRLRAADPHADHGDLLLPPCDQQRRLLLPHRTRHDRDRRSRGGGFRRAARGSGGRHAAVQARQLRAAGRRRERKAAHCRGRRGARRREDRAPSRRGYASPRPRAPTIRLSKNTKPEPGSSSATPTRYPRATSRRPRPSSRPARARSTPPSRARPRPRKRSTRSCPPRRPAPRRGWRRRWPSSRRPRSMRV